MSASSRSTVLVDSGPLIAIFDRSDTFHLPAQDWLARERRTLVTNLPVITEVCHLLDHSRLSVDGFLHFAHEALEVDASTADDLPRIRAIMAQYADLPADFADASLVAMAERRSCFTVASVDRDFTIYRGACRRSFANVLRQR